MRLFFATLLFFLTFYKISIVYSFAYLVLPLGVGSCLLFFYKSHRKFILNSLGLPLIVLFFYLLIQTLTFDVISSALFTNTTNSFFVRIISIIIISLLPAYIFSKIILEGKYTLAIKAITYAFYIQLFFWIITYLDPNIKIELIKLMGGSDESVNLREHNLYTRGFGLSQEINFTSPFMTVLVSFLFLKNYKISFLSSVTQLVNSNMVIIAILIGFIFSKLKSYIKIILVIISVYLLPVLGAEFFPRLYAEFATGGSRTVSELENNHFNLIATNFLEHAFGTFEYTFQKASVVTSDIGWVNMYNYGGLLLILEFITLLLILSYKAFGKTWLTIVWVISGCILNFKGLLFSPNSYYFFTFIAIFLKHSIGKPLHTINRD